MFYYINVIANKYLNIIITLQQLKRHLKNKETTTTKKLVIALIICVFRYLHINTKQIDTAPD